jgi:tetratricopeptide (TPR) repeat protein
MHETVAELSERIREAPSDQALYLERGIAYSSDGKVELAFADFHRAEALGDPDLVAFDLGVLFYRTGEFAAARAALTRCLARFPAHALALDYRARAAREAGDARAALADFEALFALVQGVNPGHYVSAADLLLALPGEGSHAALALLDRGMRKLGVIPQLQQRAIALERERGALDAALRRHDTLAEQFARSPEWRVTRAELLFALSRAAEARSELSAATAALAELRATPARAELAAKLARLAQTPETTRAGESGAQEKP